MTKARAARASVTIDPPLKPVVTKTRYELVLHPAFPRRRRKRYIELTGQKLLPAIELADGTIVREESRDLAKRVREGGLATR